MAVLRLLILTNAKKVIKKIPPFKPSKYFILALAFAPLLFLCERGFRADKATLASSLNTIPPETWDKLATQRIYFGHQSIGFNIIDGINDILGENPQIRLKIIETNQAEQLTGPIFAHFKIGQNGAPQSKIDDFRRIIKNSSSAKVDIAFMKLCYVDVATETDLDKIFQNYKDTLQELKKEFPETLFIHFTIPLTGKEPLWKIISKYIRGKPLRDIALNKNREAINILIRNTYEGNEPLFDLAGVESTRPDGSQSTDEENGAMIKTLVSDYSDDGAHPNQLGRKIIAAQLLHYLTRLLAHANP